MYLNYVIYKNHVFIVLFTISTMMMTASLKKTQKANAPVKLGTLPQKHWQLQQSRDNNIQDASNSRNASNSRDASHTRQDYKTAGMSATAGAPATTGTPATAGAPTSRGARYSRGDSQCRGASNSSGATNNRGASNSWDTRNSRSVCYRKFDSSKINKDDTSNGNDASKFMYTKKAGMTLYNIF